MTIPVPPLRNRFDISALQPRYGNTDDAEDNFRASVPSLLKRLMRGPESAAVPHTNLQLDVVGEGRHGCGDAKLPFESLNYIRLAEARILDGILEDQCQPKVSAANGC